jgi:hypothetical protein
MQTSITLNPGDSVTIVVPPSIPLSTVPGSGSGPPASSFDLSLPIADLSAYLVQRRMADGSPALVPGTGIPQTAADPLIWRKRDYRYDGSAGGYCASDAVLDARGFWATTWQFTPYQSFQPQLGDGGEVYVYDNGFIRANNTQDGGSLGEQFFVGRRYGGDGWDCFDDQTPTGSWRQKLVRLSESADPAAEPPLGQAFTRWRREVLTIKFRIFGAWRDITLPCIIYEHWNGLGFAAAVNVEQAIWALGWGRIWWANYEAGPAADMGQRVPALPWPAAPERSDFTMQDARLWTDIVAVGPGEATTVPWPPAGFVL